MKHLPTIGLYIIVLWMLAVVMGDWLGANHQLAASKTQYVQTVCDIERNSPSVYNQQQCTSAQDSTNSEYICNSINTSCWVEVK